MRDDAPAEDRNTTSAMPTGPIRTPGDFIAVLESALGIASDPMRKEEYASLSEAVRSAPFLIRSGEVIPKGFTPRIVH